MKKKQRFGLPTWSAECPVHGMQFAHEEGQQCMFCPEILKRVYVEVQHTTEEPLK